VRHTPAGGDVDLQVMASSVSTRRPAIHRAREGVAWFISPHGLGHAARSAAVIEAVADLRPQLHHHLFTTVAEQFFAESLQAASWTRHDRASDVGMVQRSALVEDVEATVRALDRFELDGPSVDRVADEVRGTGSCLVVCDIAPLGLAVAEKLELPAVLVENFTWDWIYRAYRDVRLAAHGAWMARLFASATRRIRTEPWCGSVPDALRVGPVSRRVRRPRQETRNRLGVGPGQRLVVVSVSGLDPSALAELGFTPPPRTALAFPTGRGTTVVSAGRTRAYGPHYHPDLMVASDAVIGKLGYSEPAMEPRQPAALVAFPLSAAPFRA
jgi:hypothetical protein